MKTKIIAESLPEKAALNGIPLNLFNHSKGRLSGQDTCTFLEFFQAQY